MVIFEPESLGMKWSSQLVFRIILLSAVPIFFRRFFPLRTTLVAGMRYCPSITFFHASKCSSSILYVLPLQWFSLPYQSTILRVPRVHRILFLLKASALHPMLHFLPIYIVWRNIIGMPSWCLVIMLYLVQWLLDFSDIPPWVLIISISFILLFLNPTLFVCSYLADDKMSKALVVICGFSYIWGAWWMSINYSYISDCIHVPWLFLMS